MKWSKGESEILANFLTQHPDLPIVAHNEWYDHWKVLKPAFERVGNLEGNPKAERWRCTLKFAKKKLNQDCWKLDAVVEACDVDPRDEDLKHDAKVDARLAGEVYMKLFEMPDLPSSKLGFWIKCTTD